MSRVLEQVKFIFVPFVNPDGYEVISKLSIYFKPFFVCLLVCLFVCLLLYSTHGLTIVCGERTGGLDHSVMELI